MLGLTTFYALLLPRRMLKRLKTYLKGRLITKNCLIKLEKEELKRIQSYNFATNAIWVFTQGSSYRFVRNTEEKCLESLLYWPMFERSNKSSGEYLKKMLKNREKA